MKISIILKDLFYWLLRPNKRQVQNDHKCPPWQRHCLPWIWDVEKLRCIFVCLTCRIVLVSSSWFWQDKHQYPGLRCFILVFWPYQQSSKSGLKDKKNSPNIISFRFFFLVSHHFFSNSWSVLQRVPGLGLPHACSLINPRKSSTSHFSSITNQRSSVRGVDISRLLFFWSPLIWGDYLEVFFDFVENVNTKLCLHRRFHQNRLC